MRLVIVRRICQAFFLLLLIWSCLVTTVGDRWFELRGYPVSWLLELDPLVGLATVLTTGTLYKGLLWGALTLAATALVGRFFCGWLCPLGTLQHLVSWVAGPERRKRYKINRYRRWFAVKYLVLTVLLAWAALGANHLGWLDPIPLLHRAFASGIRPLWHGSLAPGGWVSFGLLAAILLLSAMIPRFFCRAVCPLGALMGLFARAWNELGARLEARHGGSFTALVASAVTRLRNSSRTMGIRSTPMRSPRPSPTASPSPPTRGRACAGSAAARPPGCMPDSSGRPAWNRAPARRPACSRTASPGQAPSRWTSWRR